MENFQKQFVLALLAYGAQRDIDARRLCELSGINYHTLNVGANQSLSVQQVESLWKNASHLGNDPLFGLHFGESMQLAALGVVGQIVQTSSTVKEAITNAASLTRLITDLFEMKIRHSKRSFRIVIEADESKAEAFPATYKHMADYLTVFGVHELDGLLLEKVKPLAVRFPHAVKDTAEYVRVFGVAPRKGHEFSLEFSNSLLGQPVLSANYDLQNYLVQKIGTMMKPRAAGVLKQKIFNYILGNSYLHSLSLESVAANFNMSGRSLQRKLKEEGTTYFEVVEEARRTLAISYVTSGNYGAKNIAHILGYNESSAFLRAFKRWTGKTPSAYSCKT